MLTVAACNRKPSPEPRPPLPEQNTRLVYPALPSTTCPPLPVPPAVEASDNEWAAYKRARDNRGDECGDKLGAVDEVRRGWPAPPIDSTK